MSATNGANRAAAVLTCLVGTLILILATVTVVQFRWTKQLQQQYEESRLELLSLQTSCLDNTHPDSSLDLIFAAIQKSLEAVENYDEPKRERRQAGGSLEQMLTEMMVAQEKVLMSHCLNSSKLCVPGQKGDKGTKGDTGLPGKIGLPGKAGMQGSKGDIGPQGVNGTKGEIGPQGLPGVNGTQGPIGLQGLKGEHGASGIKGLPGQHGPPGIHGQKGNNGTTGPIGPMGKNGTIGQKGEKGDRGLNGTKGAVGPKGPVGPSGATLRKDCACIIKPKIDVLTPNGTVKYALGSPVNLFCGASSSPNTVVTWSGPLGGCVPANVSGGTVHINSLQPAQLGTYTCTATNTFGSMSKSVVIQSSTSSSTGALDCDFETGSCLWTNSKKDNLDWTRTSGRTPTSATGPNYDHTFGTTKGHYVYMETSNGRSGNFAEFVSPDLGQTPGMCLSFWYNMNGRTEGSLNVEDQACNSTTPNSILLHMAGNQGTDWHMAQIQLRSVSHTHRILIKGVHGSGGTGDIAIDDIEYYPGKCKSSLTRTSGAASQPITKNLNASLTLNCGISGIPPAVYHWKKIGGCPITATKQTLNVASHVTSGDAGVYECKATSGSNSLNTTFNVTVNGPAVEKCTFEVDWCGWTQSTTDKFDWLRFSGPTSSKDTGPNADHTLKTVSGHYAFIEASSPRVLHDDAILISHLMPAKQQACFTFSYNMYGSDTGSLKVFLEDACSHSQHEMFSMSGDKGQQWFTKAQLIPVPVIPHDYRILVKAEVGSSYHSDIAIDDLSIKFGSCT